MSNGDREETASCLHDERHGRVSTAPTRKFKKKSRTTGRIGFAVPGRNTPAAMQYLLLVYTDAELLDKLPAQDFNTKMRDCLLHSDEQQAQGKLVMCQQLEPTASARTVRVRNGRATVLDGPFAETKEMLAGFNLVEAESMEEAVRMAHELPWTEYGSIEVRPVGDIVAMRARVGA